MYKFETYVVVLIFFLKLVCNYLIVDVLLGNMNLYFISIDTLIAI